MQWFWLSLLLGSVNCCSDNEDDEFDEFYRKTYQRIQTEMASAINLAYYNWTTDMTAENEAIRKDLYRKRHETVSDLASEGVQRFKIECLISNENRFKYRSLILAAADRNNSHEIDSTIRKKLEQEFSSARICPYELRAGCSESDLMEFRNGIKPLFEITRNESALRYMWLAWRKAVNDTVAETFVTEYMSQAQSDIPTPGEAAKQSSRFLLQNSSHALEELVEDMIEDIWPFYQKVHAFVRHRLSQVYPEHVGTTGTIPAHLCGSIYCQDFENMYEFLMPYPQHPSGPDVTGEMLARNWTVTHMARTAENFFVSLGFPKLNENFWRVSVLERQEGRAQQCHPTSYDVGDGENFIIRMCGQVDQSNFQTIHHEMGHIYYFMAYKDLPHKHRHPHEAFHEGIGDTIFMSAEKNEYLRIIGLMGNFTESYESDINLLMKNAIIDVMFIPSSYIYDKWRFDLMDNIVNGSWNRHWWDLRLRYQGIHPPEFREDVIDPLSKYHVAVALPYMKYLFARLFKFMVHDHFCKKFHSDVPAHKCSIYGHRGAGAELWKMMSKGSSRPWAEMIQDVTDYSTFSTTPLLEYYQPLIDWLDEYLPTNNITVGW